MKRRESLDERQPKSGMGRSDRATDDEFRTTPPDITDAARTRGLHGQHVVDAYAPNTANPQRPAASEAAPEGVVRPEDLPQKRARGEEAD